MLSPWCDHGTIRRHLDLIVQGGLSGSPLVAKLQFFVSLRLSIEKSLRSSLVSFLASQMDLRICTKRISSMVIFEEYVFFNMIEIIRSSLLDSQTSSLMGRRRQK